MRRWGLALVILALTGGLVGCGDGDQTADQPSVPDTFVAQGTSRLSDPFADVDLESRELPEDAVLIGTGYAVALSRYGLATELTEKAVRELHLRVPSIPPPWRAGKGREFLMVHLVRPETRTTPRGDRLPTVEVVVDGQARQLSETAALPNTVIVVSVPTGADAVLTFTGSGQTQSISIRTGRLVGPSPKPATSPSASPSRAGGAVASGTVRLADYAGVPGHGPGLGWDTIVNVEIEVGLRRYDEDRGPAPDGALWAHVEVSLFASATPVTFVVDLSRSLALRTAAGQVLRVPDKTRMPVPNYLAVPGSAPDPTLTAPATWSGVFQVPERTGSLSATYRTRGTASEGGKKVTFERRDVRNSGTITLT